MEHEAHRQGPADDAVPSRPSARQAFSVAAAGVLGLGAFGAMAVAGEPKSEAELPTVTTLPGTEHGAVGYPFCTVVVRDTSAGPTLVVSLLNDLRDVWVQLWFVDGTHTVLHVPVDAGWGLAELPREPEVDHLRVYGSEELIDYTASCGWARPDPDAPTTSTTTG